MYNELYEDISNFLFPGSKCYFLTFVLDPDFFSSFSERIFGDKVTEFLETLDVPFLASVDCSHSWPLAYALVRCDSFCSRRWQYGRLLVTPIKG